MTKAEKVLNLHNITPVMVFNIKGEPAFDAHFLPDADLSGAARKISAVLPVEEITVLPDQHVISFILTDNHKLW